MNLSRSSFLGGLVYHKLN